MNHYYKFILSFLLFFCFCHVFTKDDNLNCNKYMVLNNLDIYNNKYYKCLCEKSDEYFNNNNLNIYLSIFFDRFSYIQFYDTDISIASIAFILFNIIFSGISIKILFINDNILNKMLYLTIILWFYYFVFIYFFTFIY